METQNTPATGDALFDDVARRGLAIYEEKLRAILEPEQNGKAVAINVETGEYVVADDLPDARRLLREKYPPRTISMSRIIGPETDASFDDLARRGVTIYNEHLKSILEPAHNGKAVAINVDTGEYIIADDPPEARRLFHEKYGTPNGISMTIGPETDLLMLARAMIGRKPIRMETP